MRLHDAGEKALKKELEDGGFVVEATKYHEVKSLCDVIQYDFSITAIMAKSKSDQFAAHKTFDLSFYWEFKRSHRNPVDWVPFELTQFAQLYDLSHLYGVRVIYFHYSHLGLKAFQMSDLPRIREIVIPKKPGVSFFKAFVGALVAPFVVKAAAEIPAPPAGDILGPEWVCGPDALAEAKTFLDTPHLVSGASGEWFAKFDHPFLSEEEFTALLRRTLKRSTRR
jgi:hypothetical protein